MRKLKFIKFKLDGPPLYSSEEPQIPSNNEVNALFIVAMTNISDGVRLMIYTVLAPLAFWQNGFPHFRNDSAK